MTKLLPPVVPSSKALNSCAASDDATTLAANAKCAQKQMRAPSVATKVQEPPDIFPKMRKLEAGWDGYDSAPPSAKLIKAAEALWSIFKSNFPSEEEPSVLPGPNSLIEFCWSNTPKRKELIIGLYGSDNISCDWHLELAGTINPGELDHFDLEQLLQEIYVYLYF